ncbi:TPA: PrgH/EprH family type III secretion apparatus protein [Escherichia coli]|uniref:PrgH/EprH family type III secretion apparatus protein n=1 Tax=Escherichia coli TaxID=562 RepID=UPI0005A7F618|nr:PrgH/EprH family type III secretion apparatus protein [Escherichia coli]EFB7635445.1 PrgH/EprH family type III secretion apparatus protein [Escherichia coli]EKF3431401.1 PrgH/EprH family type III secretion apparatus protein [Escherichia coli]EKM0415821.1 PrgH/EprH family type III secretion apparatus protein [Escherichia coli]ELO7641551.1 PrgH/EprH family type III secretion apparatus protein [Escherichia coli]MCN4992858.1 PrgH/EprH family type III secretion apparatus protein [Escherichia col
MENNDKFLSQDLLESYAIRLLSGPLNGCEYEILNGRVLVIVGNDVSLGRSDSFSELPENTIVIPYGELTGSFEVIITTDPDLVVTIRELTAQEPEDRTLTLNQQIEVLGLKFAVKVKNEVWQYSIPGIVENNITSTRQHFFRSTLFKYVTLFFLFAIIFIAFYIVNASNDPQLRRIDKILVNKNRNYEILYGRDHVIYINTNSLDEAVWVKQALEKNQPGKPVRVINPDDESIRIFSWLADNFPDLQYFKLQLLDASNPRLTVSKQRNAITQQLIDNLIKGLLQTMPYASNISIAVLDDNVLESQAIETLSAIGLSYEKYKTANNVYFNIIGTLSDSELNKINNYVDEYYKQWGKQYVRFNVNLKNQDTNNSSFSYGDNRFEKSQGSKWTFQE